MNQLSCLKRKSGYELYRGKCLERAERAVERNPSLNLVRGYYWCPIWNTREQHWWCERSNGEIHDPTRRQFPSAGAGAYEPFDGMLVCCVCGDEFREEDVYQGMGGGPYCSYDCYGVDIGMM